MPEVDSLESETGIINEPACPGPEIIDPGCIDPRVRVADLICVQVFVSKYLFGIMATLFQEFPQDIGGQGKIGSSHSKSL